jgi:hypothetical protein
MHAGMLPDFQAAPSDQKTFHYEGGQGGYQFEEVFISWQMQCAEMLG